MYEQHLEQYDWFMKADDDSFVMVDNLRLFLSNYDPEVPHFFGEACEKRHVVQQCGHASEKHHLIRFTPLQGAVSFCIAVTKKMN